MKNQKKKQMHLLLVYPDFLEADTDKKSGGGSYSEGIASISAVVKQGGHKVSLMHLSRFHGEKDYKKRLSEFKDVDLIGFSTRTTAFEYVKDLIKWTRDKDKKVFLMCGGYHAILVPDEFMQIKGLDAVVVGEGEYPTLDLMNRMSEGKDYYNLESFYFKKGNEVIKNPVRPLIEDLDDLPFPDIDIFDYKNLDSTRLNQALIMLSRGCVYMCTYCGNSQFRNVYPNKVKYARFRSPKKSIELIKTVLKKYPNINTLNFRDAIFNMYPKWYDEFIQLYIKEIKLPFTCNLRFDIITEDTVKTLKEAGCFDIDIGLESGDEEIRKKYLQRFTTDEQMIRCANWFSKYKIKVITYNIIGLPYEDLHKALKTVKLNAKFRSSEIIPNIFYPYPMTVLEDTARKAGFLREITPKTKVFIKQPQFPDHEVLFVVRYFKYYVKRYRWCFAKDTKFRKFMEKYYDFWFTGPLTPRRFLVFLAECKKYIRGLLKRILINHFSKLYIFLRNMKHGIKKTNKQVK